ncbi:MAG: hypothetical protein RSB37_05645, partial [Acetivibrio sp.]
MYIIAIIIYAMAVVFLLGFGNGGTSLWNYVDLPSILVIIMITVPMLAAAGVLGDMKKIFHFAVTKPGKSS